MTLKLLVVLLHDVSLELLFFTLLNFRPSQSVHVVSTVVLALGRCLIIFYAPWAECFTLGMSRKTDSGAV